MYDVSLCMLTLEVNAHLCWHLVRRPCSTELEISEVSQMILRTRPLLLLLLRPRRLQDNHRRLPDSLREVLHLHHLPLEKENKTFNLMSYD